jgi:hypothetical protein
VVAVDGLLPQRFALLVGLGALGSAFYKLVQVAFDTLNAFYIHATYSSFRL